MQSERTDSCEPSHHHHHTLAGTSMISALAGPQAHVSSSGVANDPLAISVAHMSQSDGSDQQSCDFIRLTSQNAAASDFRSSVSSRSGAPTGAPLHHHVLHHQQMIVQALGGGGGADLPDSPLVEVDRVKVDAFGSDDDYDGDDDERRHHSSQRSPSSTSSTPQSCNSPREKC